MPNPARHGPGFFVGGLRRRICPPGPESPIGPISWPPRGLRRGREEFTTWRLTGVYRFATLPSLDVPFPDHGGSPMFYQTETKAQGWRAMAKFEDGREALLLIGRSSAQVRQGDVEACAGLLDEDGGRARVGS